MARYLPDIRAAVRQVLNDEFVEGTDYEWQTDEIDIHIGLCLQEVSEASPYTFREVLTTIENSRVLDISSITDLIEIEKLGYPSDDDPNHDRNYIPRDAETILMDITLVPKAGGSGTLTGTVTFTNGSAAITGSGTDFDGELEAGYHIKKSTGTRWYRIYSITSDTALVLAEPCLEATGADTADVTQYCYETVYLYCNKLHSLTEYGSTLSLQAEKVLIDGASAMVALSWINGVRTQVAAAKSDLSTGRDYINTISHGGRPEGDYATYARTEGGLASLINSYQVWANNKLTLYHAGLKRISKFQTYKTYPKD